MKRSLILSIALSPLLFLSACYAPEGWKWEKKMYTDIPYDVNGDEQSTAGAQVAYVLVKLAPEKGLKVAQPKAVEPKESKAPPENMEKKVSKPVDEKQTDEKPKSNGQFKKKPDIERYFNESLKK